MASKKIAQTTRQTDLEIIETETQATELLNELITLNRDIIEVLHTAVNQLQQPDTRKLLNQYISRHEAFITELSGLVTRYSGTPKTDGTSTNLLKRAWVTLKATVTEGDGPILAEVAEDIQTMLLRYGKVMGETVPEDVRDVIRPHISHLRLAHEKLLGYSAAYDR